MDAIYLIIAWLIIGAIIGWLAHVFVKSRDERNALIDIGVGIGGAVIAGVVFAILDVPRVSNYTTWSLVSALVGAGVLMFLFRMYTNVPSPRRE
jgi:uncharacterized membrane protein YeaQ/YmgE (transglycosylase-associated protein family)